MFQLFEHVAKFTIASGTGSNCDDFVDRLNRKYTIYLLLLCCAIISSKQYVGEPLSCFCPSHFTGSHVEYTNNICWISNAYYVPIDDMFSLNGVHTSNKDANIVAENDDDKPNSPIRVVRVNNLIAYYPFLLLIQAVFFYIPYFLWKNIVNHSAYDINTLITYAKDTQTNEQSSEHREKALKYLIRHIDRASNYYNTKKILKFQSGYESSDGDDETTIVTETSKVHFEDEFDDKQKTLKRKTVTNNPNSTFDYNIRRPLKNYKNNNKNRTKFKNCFRTFILDTLCEKFLFTLYLIIKLFYFTNSFGQLLVLNKLITGDTNSIQKLFTTLSASSNSDAAANNIYNHQKKILESIFTISNRNDVLLIQQKFDNNNYFLTAGNNIWTGFEFGYKTIINLVQTGSLFNSQTKLLIFHSVIFCDFKIRVLGDRLHKHTVQCVAPINIFSEKLFTIVWFWFLILSIINAYNLIEWLCFYFFSRVRFNFILNYLYLVFNNKNNNNNKKSSFDLESCSDNCKHSNFKLKSKQKQQQQNFDELYDNNNRIAFKFKLNEKISNIKHNLDKDTAKKIIKSYLELDNLFIIRIISKNTNEIVTQELITLLLDFYQNKNQVLVESNGNGYDAESKKSINL
jgi:hypothetical protein